MRTYDGIAKLWIDGEFKHQETGIDFTQGRTAALDGWARFAIGENQACPNNTNRSIGYHIAYQDWDDILIYNQTPPNRDAEGNLFIGPIVSTQEDSTSPAAPQGLSVS